MPLVDKDIKSFLLNGQIAETSQTAILDGDANCITNIGYDLRADFFAKDGKLVEYCALQPGESVFVQSKEIISFDMITSGRVALKNSRIRMGLTLDAPVYQPGHKTKIFFRLTNLSSAELALAKGEKYAMLMFDQLLQAPAQPYTGAFVDEFSFKGLADYRSEYTSQIKSINGKLKNLQDVEKSIYANVIAILAVFVAVFTLLDVNIDLVGRAASGRLFLQFNLTVLGAISFLCVLLAFLLNREAKPSKWLWLIPVCCFSAVLLLCL